MELGGFRQYMFLKYRAMLRLKEPTLDGQIDDVVLARERRSVAVRRLLEWAACMAAYFLLMWHRIAHPDAPVYVTGVVVLGLPLGLFAMVRTLNALFDTIAPRDIPCLRVHLHFADGEPARACVLHDGRMGQESLSPTIAAIAKGLGVRVTVLRTDAPIDKHRTTSCRC